MAYDIELLRSIAQTEPDPAVTEYLGKSTVVSPVVNTSPTTSPTGPIALPVNPSVNLSQWAHAHPPEESHHRVLDPRSEAASVLGEANPDLGPAP